MVQKFLKKVGIISAVVALSLTFASPVAADSGSILERLESTETDADSAEDISINPLRGQNLNLGKSKITKLSSRQVNVYSLTQGHRICDTIYLTMTLEWKVDGTYSTYKTWDFTENNVSNLSKSYNVIVPSGHYYRVRGYHAAKDGGIKESTTTLTNGILVN